MLILTIYFDSTLERTWICLGFTLTSQAWLLVRRRIVVWLIYLFGRLHCPCYILMKLNWLLLNATTNNQSLNWSSVNVTLELNFSCIPTYLFNFNYLPSYLLTKNSSSCNTFLILGDFGRGVFLSFVLIIKARKKLFFFLVYFYPENFYRKMFS